jgi:hypothetical protein
MTRNFFFALGFAMILALAPFAAAQGFELTSPDIKPDGVIGQKFVYGDCGGDNVSPELTWSDPPEGAKSFAVLVHDPDAPGAGFWHWIVIDIPASAHSLPQGAGTRDGKKLPPGSVQIETDFGDPGWGGPCPPAGRPHRYQFTVYALGVEKLAAPSLARPALVHSLVEKAALGKAGFTARYGR